MTLEDKIVEAIDRNTDMVRTCARFLAIIWITMMAACTIAKAAPLVSDGDEIASVGTVQVTTPHPAWAPALGGTSWISIAQTGWPLATWLPNGTVVSFSEVFTLDSMPSSAMVTWAADDSASVWLNGSLVAPEAPAAGNGYSTCSDFAPTCTSHTTADILPWLLVGSNEIRFDVAQRGGWSYGLNYSVGLMWLDDPVSVPEPGTIALFALAALVLLVTQRVPLRVWWLLFKVRWKLQKAKKLLEQEDEIARKALELEEARHL